MSTRVATTIERSCKNNSTRVNKLAHDNYLMVIDVLNYGLLISWKKLAKDATGIHLCNYKYNFKIPSMTKEASQLACCKKHLIGSM